MIYPTDEQLETAFKRIQQLLFTAHQVQDYAVFLINGCADTGFDPVAQGDATWFPEVEAVRYSNLPDDDPDQDNLRWMYIDDTIANFHHFLRHLPNDIREAQRACLLPGIDVSLAVQHSDDLVMDQMQGDCYTDIALNWGVQYGKAILGFWEKRNCGMTVEKLLTTPAPGVRGIYPEPEIYADCLYDIAVVFANEKGFQQERLTRLVEKEIQRARWWLPAVAVGIRREPDHDEYLSLLFQRGGRLSQLQQELYDIVKASKSLLSQKVIVDAYTGTYGCCDASSIGNALAAMTAAGVLRKGTGGRGYMV